MPNRFSLASGASIPVRTPRFAIVIRHAPNSGRASGDYMASHLRLAGSREPKLRDYGLRRDRLELNYHWSADVDVLERCTREV